MALYLTPKPPSSVYLYTWEPPLASGDSIATATLTVTSGTAAIDSYEQDGEVVSFLVSGGAADENTVISASVTTGEGETLTDTIYIPIVVSTKKLAETARDIVYFALKNIAGRGEDPTATELEDGLEVLNAMLLEWRIDGINLGLDVLAENDAVLAADEYITAIKYNLRVLLEAEYRAESSPFDIRMAERGKMLVSTQLLNMGNMGFLETNNVRRAAAYDGSY